MTKMDNQKISRQQVLFLMFNACTGTGIIISPDLIRYGGRATGIAQFTSVFLLVPLIIWTIRLGQYAPGLTILDIIEKTLGKFVGKLICLMYVLISISISIISSGYVCTLLQLFLLPTTPILVTSLMLLSLAMMIARSGIEVLARMTEVLFIMVNIIFWLGTSVAFANINFDYIYPFFDRRVGDMLKTTLFQSGATAEAVLFLFVLVSAMQRPKDNYKVVIFATVFVTQLLAFGSELAIGVYSAEYAAKVPNILSQVGFDVQSGKFIQGLDVFIQISTFIRTILVAAFFIFAASKAGLKITNNQFPKIWLVIITFGTISGVVFIPSLLQVISLSMILVRYVTLPFVVLVLLCTTLGIIIKGRKVIGQAK